MMVSRSHVKTAGWAMVLLCCAGAVAMLMFKVNAVRSEVRKAEERIVQLQRDNLYLETEFETRASQQQLAALNRMEFGYIAPGPDQFLANERALAAFSEPRATSAPLLIRVADDDVAEVELASFTGEIAAATAGDEAELASRQREEQRKPPPAASFQRAVVETIEADKPARSQPSFAALFADYKLDKDPSE